MSVTGFLSVGGYGGRDGVQPAIRAKAAASGANVRMRNMVWTPREGGEWTGSMRTEKYGGDRPMSRRRQSKARIAPGLFRNVHLREEG